MTDESNQFELIEDIKSAIFYLVTAAKELSPCMLWTENRAAVLYSHLTQFDQRKRILHVPLKADSESEQFLEAMKRQKSKQIYFCVSHPTANLFFSTLCVAQDSTRLKFQEPLKLYKVQRRSIERYRIPLHYSFKIEFDHPNDPQMKMKHQIYDVSAGGVSFIVTQEEKSIYQKGQILKNCVLSVRLRKIEVAVEILYQKELPPNSITSGIKVGADFQNLSKEDQNFLLLFVAEGNQERFMKSI